MDESWRMRMGHPTNSFPARRSVGTSPGNPVDDDFSDVFGGPPRTVLLRKLSGDFTNSASFYDEIFRQPEFCFPARANSGRSLPAFRIPARSEGFYSDVFGSEDERVSRERSRSHSRAKSVSISKSNSTPSVLSSEDMSPFRTVNGDDGGLSSFAAKLRPLNVPAKWNSSPKVKNHGSFFVDNHYVEDEHEEKFYHGYYSRPMASSPATISVEPNSFGSANKMSAEDDLELNSASSVVSSVCVTDPEMKSGMLEEDVYDDDDDEVASSIVLEFGTSDRTDKSGEAISIDEAIAWAKETFQRQDSAHENKHPTKTVECRVLLLDQDINRNNLQQSQGEQPWTTDEGKLVSDADVKLKMWDEEINLWSAGKETNIRVLLSTLDHILWPNSGWSEVPLTGLIENKQVKKAYQKARLCLHPDKLQQRGATTLQKYIADKVFTILQDAWEAFNSQDVLLTSR